MQLATMKMSLNQLWTMDNRLSQRNCVNWKKIKSCTKRNLFVWIKNLCLF